MAYFVFGFTLISLYELFNDETFSLATDKTSRLSYDAASAMRDP